MALSKAATKLLEYLGIYRLTPTQFANRLATGEYTQSWVNVDWFATSIGRTAYGYKPSVKKGLFKQALTELIDAGY